MHNGMIKVVTGIRRCGKSYLLFNLFGDYLKAQGVDDEHIIKVDLEDRRNKNLRNPDALLEYIDTRIAKEGMHYVMLDDLSLDVIQSQIDVPCLFALAFCPIAFGIPHRFGNGQFATELSH